MGNGNENVNGEINGNVFYSDREMIASGGWLDKKCYYCGRRFEEGDKIVLLVFSFEVKKAYKSLSLNAVIHKEEYETLLEGVNGNVELFISSLGNHKTPRVKLELTKEMQTKIEAFKKAAYDLGFRIGTDAIKGESLYKMRMNGSSVTFTYNPFTDRIGIKNKFRGSRSLGYMLMEQTLSTKLFNRMHGYLGDGQYDDFSADKVVQNAIDETNRIMNK